MKYLHIHKLLWFLIVVAFTIFDQRKTFGANTTVQNTNLKIDGVVTRTMMLTFGKR